MKITKFIVTYCILLTLFLLLITISSAIPSAFLKQNIGHTVKTLSEEELYPEYGLYWRQIRIDNWTDAVMFNTSYSINSKNPFRSALMNFEYRREGDPLDRITDLKLLYENNYIPNVTYERYWHGYLVWLRPLLLIFSLNEIRVLLSFLLYILFFICILLLLKRFGKKLAFIFSVGLISIDFFYVGHNLNFSSVFLIGLLSSIYLLIFGKTGLNTFLFFFIIGAITSFFDLFTAPLVTLGMILVIFMCLNINNKHLYTAMSHSVCWLFGYLLLWSSKWIIVTYLYLPNGLINALERVQLRILKPVDLNFSQLNAIKLNILQLVGNTIEYNWVVVIFVVCMFLLILKFGVFTRNRLKNIVPWFFTFSIPYLWYFIAANHSYLHAWFTYRDQFLSIVSLCLAIFEIIDWKKLKNVLKYERIMALFHKQ
jgi:hypothetical protein